jgi:hypothetical protein
MCENCDGRRYPGVVDFLALAKEVGYLVVVIALDCWVEVSQALLSSWRSVRASYSGREVVVDK